MKYIANDVTKHVYSFVNRHLFLKPTPSILCSVESTNAANDRTTVAKMLDMRNAHLKQFRKEVD